MRDLKPLRGTIIKVSRTQPHGWISHKGLTDCLGNPVEPFTNKDIHIHADDCDTPLRVGMQVEFYAVADERRRDARRAVEATEFVFVPPQVELHFDQREISNPTVGYRACFTPDIHRRMLKGLEEGYGYSMLLVIREKDDTYGHREHREIRDPKLPFGFITFSRPGDWDVGLVLFERKNITPGTNPRQALERILGAEFLNRDKDDERYTKRLPDLDLHGRRTQEMLYDLNVQGNLWEGEPIASFQVAVSVPNGIFAKPPSPAMKAFANRFSRRRSRDECQFRRRKWAMFTVGLLPWLLLEIINRGRQLIGGLFQLWFGLRGSWPNVLKTFEATPHFRVSLALPDTSGKDEFYSPWNSNRTWFLNPAFLTVGAALAWWISSLWRSGSRAAGSSSMLLLYVVGVVAIMAFGVWLVLRLRRPESREAKSRRLHEEALAERAAERAKAEAKRKLEEQRRQMTVDAGRNEAATIARHADALVCGEATHQVTLAALPPEMRTYRLRFAALKRTVCRPFV